MSFYFICLSLELQYVAYQFPPSGTNKAHLISMCDIKNYEHNICLLSVFYAWPLRRWHLDHPSPTNPQPCGSEAPKTNRIICIKLFSPGLLWELHLSSGVVKLTSALSNTKACVVAMVTAWLLNQPSAWKCKDTLTNSHREKTICRNLKSRNT